MPKQHFSEAPADVRLGMDRWQRETRMESTGGSFDVQAVGFENAMTYAYRRGYDVRPEDVPTPATDRVHRFEGSAVDLAAIKRVLVFELKYEERCLRLAHSKRAWAALPSEAELAEARRVERERLQTAQQLEQRTNELADAAEAKRVAGVKAKAREQASRELEQ